MENDELLPCNSEAVWVLPFLIMSSEIPTWHNVVSYAAPRAGNPTSDGRHAIWPGALKPEVDASARPALASGVRKHRSVLQHLVFRFFCCSTMDWCGLHVFTVSTNYLEAIPLLVALIAGFCKHVGPMDQSIRFLNSTPRWVGRSMVVDLPFAALNVAAVVPHRTTGRSPGVQPPRPVAGRSFLVILRHLVWDVGNS